MPAGPCQRCGAGEVRCKGLCSRCYSAARYQRPVPVPVGPEVRALERSWDAHALTVVLMAERPQPGRENAPWTAQAACRDHVGLPWDGRAVTDEIRAVCEACPVRAACLAEALADRAVAGVWAATTAAERAVLRQRRLHHGE